jgi:hypothetical protein
MTTKAMSAQRTKEQVIRQQTRERDTGRYAFQGDWGRKCVCGHELGVHTAEAPHECMNSDRNHIASEKDGWFDATIEPTRCKLHPLPAIAPVALTTLQQDRRKWSQKQKQ